MVASAAYLARYNIRLRSRSKVPGSGGHGGGCQQQRGAAARCDRRPRGVSFETLKP